MATPLLPPATTERPMTEDERIELTTLMQLGPPKTFDPVENPRDQRAVATVAELRPRVVELEEAIRSLRRAIHGTARKRIRALLIVALFLVELVAVRLSLMQAGFAEPLPTLIALGVTLGSFGIAIWASHQAGVKRWLGIFLLVLLVGGVALLRFDETNNNDESAVFTVGRALILTVGVAIPLVLAEHLLRQHAENKRNEDELARLEAELVDDQQVLQENDSYIDQRRAEEAADHDQRVRLAARLRLTGTTS